MCVSIVQTYTERERTHQNQNRRVRRTSHPPCSSTPRSQSRARATRRGGSSSSLCPPGLLGLGVSIMSNEYHQEAYKRRKRRVWRRTRYLRSLPDGPPSNASSSHCLTSFTLRTWTASSAYNSQLHSTAFLCSIVENAPRWWARTCPPTAHHSHGRLPRSPQIWAWAAQQPCPFP